MKIEEGWNIYLNELPLVQKSLALSRKIESNTCFLILGCSIVTNLLTNYVINNDMTFEEFKVDLKRHVTFILSGNQYSKRKEKKWVKEI